MDLTLSPIHSHDLWGETSPRSPAYSRPPPSPVHGFIPPSPSSPPRNYTYRCSPLSKKTLAALMVDEHERKEGLATFTVNSIYKVVMNIFSNTD